jgi:hypothetical protein
MKGLRSMSETYTMTGTMQAFYGYWWFTGGLRPA